MVERLILNQFSLQTMQGDINITSNLSSFLCCVTYGALFTL